MQKAGDVPGGGPSGSVRPVWRFTGKSFGFLLVFPVLVSVFFGSEPSSESRDRAEKQGRLERRQVSGSQLSANTVNFLEEI